MTFWLKTTQWSPSIIKITEWQNVTVTKKMQLPGEFDANSIQHYLLGEKNDNCLQTARILSLGIKISSI